MSENNEKILQPAAVAGFMLESNLEAVPKFIKYLNKTTDPQPGVETKDNDIKKPASYSEAAKTWMSNNWNTYIELVRAFVFWNSEPVAETRKKCKWLLEFQDKNPELAENLFNLESFVIPDRDNDAYNWSTIEEEVAYILKRIKFEDQRKNNQEIYYANNDNGKEFFDTLRALCVNLTKVHHTARSANSPLRSAEEARALDVICQWYVNDDYWINMSYESLSDFHESNKAAIDAIYKVATEAQKMIEKYPLGLTPVYDQSLDKYHTSVLVGYMICKNREELMYYLRCLNQDGSILNIRYLPGAASGKVFAEDLESEEKASEEAEPIEEPEESGYNSWTNFGAGSLV